MRRTLRWVGMLVAIVAGTTASFAQAYVPTNSSLNVGNPGGIRTSSDFTTTGYTNIHPNTTTDNINNWSAVQTIPFSFNFNGSPVTKFVVSQNGLLSFDTTLATTVVNSMLDTNRALPYSSLPNNTIAYFWDNFTNVSSGDVIYMGVEGTAPNRQLWILNYSFKIGVASFAYFGMVLEESTDRIYVVDMNYHSNGGALTSTVGIQVNSSTAYQVTSGLNSAAGSPNIIMGPGSTGAADNEYYQFDFYPAGSLIPPLNVMVTGTTTTTASISWDAVLSPATGAELEYGLAGYTQGSGTAVNGLSGTSTTISNLLPATTYEFYMRSANGSSQSNWVGPYQFSTACASIVSFPYDESFDNVPWANATSTTGSKGNQTHTLAPCWATASTSTSTTSALQWWVYQGTTPSGFSLTGPSGDHTTGSSKYVFIESSYGVSTTDTAFFVTPEFYLDTLTTPEFSFFYYAFGANIGSYGVQASTDGGITWSTVWASTGAVQTDRASDPWAEMILDVSLYSSANTSFRIFATKTGTYGDFAIDDISIHEAPPCPKVTSISMSACGTTADLSWLSGGSSFNLEWGPSGFTQGTGMTATVNGTDTTLTGLFASTSYDVYIQNNCASSGNGTSIWSGPYTFTTAISAPYLEEFNTTTFPPSGWSRAQGIAANPTTFTNTSSNWGYGTMGYVSSNTYAARINLWSTNHYNWLISPLIDLGDGTTPYQLEFDAALTAYASVNGATLGVDDTVLFIVSEDGGATWNRADRFFEFNSSTPIPNGTGGHYVASLAGYTGCVKIGIYTQSTVSNADNYFYIDNFYLRTPPACQEPFAFVLDSVSTNAAGFTWQGDTNSTPTYNIEWGECGFTPGTGMTATVSTDSAYITGLTSSSCYDVYIQTNCGSSTSTVSGPFTFYTLCDTFALPWSEGFENNAINAMPQCWERTNGTTYWNTSNTTGSYNRAPNTGSNYLQIRWTSNTTQFAFTPRFHLNANTSYVFSFYMVTDGYANWNEVSLWMGGSQDASAMITPVGAPMYFPTNTTYQQFTYQFIPSDTGDYHFGLKVISDGVPWYLSFDDFNLQVDPNPCPNAGGLTATNITSSTADLDWGALPTIGGFNVEYGPQGYTQGNGTLVTGLTSSNYTASSLSPNTYYDYYVQVVCGGSPGNWVGPYTFKTECVGQLNGAYTVGGAAGPSNFATLDSAISTLVGCGITGPVTFNIAAGTYYGSYQLGEIQGASNTNTITFNGAGANATTIMSDTSFTSNVQAVFDLNGAKHLTFKNLGVVQSGSANAYAFRLMNNADSNAVEDCYVQADTMGGVATASAIVLTGSTTSPTSYGGDVDYFTLMNSEVVGGYYGFVANGGSTADLDEGHHIEGNTFRKQYYYGIRFYYEKNFDVIGNDVRDFRNTYNYASYGYYISNFRYEDNNVMSYYYGIYASQANVVDADTVNSRIVNNMSVGTGSYGGYLYGNNIDVYHNTFLSTASYGCYIADLSSTMDVRNNIFHSATSYALYTSIYTMSQLNYNMYSDNYSSIAYYGGSAIADLTAWQTAYPAANANSVHLNATFVNAPEDLHLTGTAGNDVGDNTVGVTTDIDGDARPATGSTTVDMGADEYTPLAWDAVAVKVYQPSSGCGDSTVPVSVIVKNNGTNAITSMMVKADVSGSVNTTLSATYSGNIASLSYDTVTVGTINMYTGGNVDIMGYVELANDGDGSNDSTAIASATFTPYEPDFYAPDTVCNTIDSAMFAAVSVPGAQHGWFANATDTVPVATGDTFTFPVAGGAQTNWYVGFTGSADSLMTTNAAGNGSTGNMFDIVAKQTVTITGFSQLITSTTQQTVEVWYRTGTYFGNTSSNAGWILLGQATVTPNASPSFTYYPINFSVTIPAGQTYGFYVTTTGGSVGYTNGTAVGNVYSSNAYFDVLEGHGGGYFNLTNNPRVFNGIVRFGGDPCSDIKKMVSLPTIAAPVASTTHNITSVTANDATVAFDASSTTDGDTYDWDFGDTTTGTGVMPTHIYSNNGTYVVALTVTNDCGSSTAYDTVVVEGISVEENFFNGTVEMYPNPSTGKVNLSVVSDVLNGNMQVQVVDLFGRVVLNDLIENANAEWNKSYDLSDLAAGTYVIQIQSNAGTYNHRLVMTK